MTKKWLIWVALLFVLLLAACGKETDGKDSTKEESKETKKITVLSEIYEGSSITAFEQDLIKELAKVNHWDITVKNTKWDDLFVKVKESKDVVAISGITASEERKKDYNFSDTYFKAYQLGIVNKDSKTESFADLSNQGKKFGVQKETTAVYLLKDLLKDGYTNVKEYDSFEAGMNDYFNGQVDVFVADNAILLDYLKQNKKDGYKLINDPSAPAEDWGIMIQKGNDELTKEVNEGLEKLKDNGTYDEIYSKYFGQ